MSDTSDISARQAVLLDAELIRRRRINLRMTERQLGRLVGKSGQLVRRIEAGLSHEGVTVRVAHRLAEALDVPLPMLFLQEVKRSEGAEAAEAGTERNGIEADLACI